MSIAQNFPTISPSLSLDFANVQALDPRITYARASTATYYGTRTALAEQNLLLQSQTFDNASWDKLGSAVTANAAVAPDGTSTADLLVSNNAATLSYLRQQPPIPTGGTDVLTVYAKYLNYQYVVLNIRTGAVNRYCWFDVLNGVVGTNSSGGTASIQNVGNGWYRLILSRANEGSTMQCNFYVATTDASLTIAGDGVSGNYFWGAQLEKRDQASAYTVTTTQPISNYIPILETAASGVARFDHNPTTFESLGLLVEQQSTNLLQRSDDFSNAYWDVKSNSSITANTIVSPDGTLNADKLVENTANGQHWVGSAGSGATITSGVTYTLSLYAKQAERGYLALQGDAGGGRLGVPTVFNLTDGTVFSVGAGTTAAISSVGNGWYRCVVIATASSTGTAYPYFGLRQNSSPAAVSYTGDGWSGLFIWGAQLEALAFPTSYIPTVASQVTRAADSATMTGTNFSSFYNQAAGSLYVECNYFGGSGLAAEFGQTASASNRWYTLGNNGSNRAQFVMRPLGSVQADINDSGVSIPPNTMTKISVAYAVNDFAISQNGRSPITDTSGYVTNDLNQLIIGNTSAGNASLNGIIRKIAYYPIRLSNTNLQALTG